MVTTSLIRALLLSLCIASAPTCAIARVQATTSATVPSPVATTLPRDQVIAQVPTLADPRQQYSLYLPAQYAPDRPLPLLIILDARGRGEQTVQMALQGARANGWIVMSSLQSRSDTLESITLQALQALLDEAAHRFHYDGRRLYLAGFSGTAKTLWTQVDALRGPLAGMIGCGGGRPPGLGRLRRAPPAFFGMAGTRDFNYQEMRGLDDTLSDVGATHRLEVFEGGHGWPPDPVLFTAAIDWLQLMAMRDGRETRSAQWIDAQLAAARDAIDDAPDGLEHWRRTDQLVRDFDGLRDVAAFKAAAARLAASDAVRSALSAEEKMRRDERRHGKRFDTWRMRTSARYLQERRQDPPDTTRALSELRIRTLQRQAADTSDRKHADSAARVLERDYVGTAFYLPRQLVAQGDYARAAAMLAIAGAIFPQRPAPHWDRAQVLATDGRIDDAFLELHESARLGRLDIDNLRSDSVWQPLRQDPRWQVLLKQPMEPLPTP